MSPVCLPNRSSSSQRTQNTLIKQSAFEHHLEYIRLGICCFQNIIQAHNEHTQAQVHNNTMIHSVHVLVYHVQWNLSYPDIFIWVLDSQN